MASEKLFISNRVFILKRCQRGRSCLINFESTSVRNYRLFRNVDTGQALPWPFCFLLIPPTILLRYPLWIALTDCICIWLSRNPKPESAILWSKCSGLLRLHFF